jgi:hypothetical protein
MTNQHRNIHSGDALFWAWLAINLLVVSAMVLIPPWKVAHFEQWPGMDTMIQHDRRGDSIGTWGPLQWAPVWHSLNRSGLIIGLKPGKQSIPRCAGRGCERNPAITPKLATIYRDRHTCSSWTRIRCRRDFLESKRQSSSVCALWTWGSYPFIQCARSLSKMWEDPLMRI